MWQWFTLGKQQKPATPPEATEEMAQILSNQDGLTVSGRKYARGEPIPVEALQKLPERRLTKLLDQHKVREDHIRVARGEG